ncbi:MAG: cobB2 [Myxococcaceae bacterium]|nr:cobB2 [Myxococcaceae bacterium]
MGGTLRVMDLAELPVAQEAEVEQLVAWFGRGPVAVLTGAGISTESGIPDYRGPETRRRARNPIQYRDFLRKPEARQRYWARSMLGWPRFSCARPNAGHAAVAKLERAGLLSGVLTQNVDGLHGAAGSRELVELHGALSQTLCLSCQRLSSRAELQTKLEQANPELAALAPELAPDGDAELTDPRLGSFRVIDCSCGGPLKPHVVFFGENVPPARVARAMQFVEQAAGLLVVGSSLAVYSGLRFVHAAEKRGTPVALLTLGPTRGDASASLRIEAGAGATLTRLTERLGL